MHQVKTFEQALATRIDQTTKRIPGIDVLRALSILTVILLHANLRIRFTDTPLGQHLPDQFSLILFHSGRYGVIVFFAISGFLITSTCLRRWKGLDRISLGSFYRMRAARIAPLLCALLALLSLLHFLRLRDFTIDPRRASLSQAVFSALTFHLNWLESRHGYLPGAWDILWSLSVEEMFYVFFPFACLLLRRRVRIVALLCLFIVVGPFARTVFTHNPIWAHHSYLSCMDAISMGCLSAIASRQWTLNRRLVIILRTGGLALVILTFARPPFAVEQLDDLGLDITALALGTSMMLMTFVASAPHSGLFAGALQWLGVNSYEIYLTHMFVVYLFAALVERLQQPTTMLYLSSYFAIVFISGVLGAIVERYYSAPANLLLRRWPAVGPNAGRAPQDTAAI